MAHFILIANQITQKDFEKTLEIANKSGAKVEFVPQGGNRVGVNSSAMHSVELKDKEEPGLSSVRFEWAEDGANFGAKIVTLFARV